MPIPEMVQSVAAATTAGYTVGMFVELGVQRAISKEDRKLSEEMGSASDGLPEPSLGRRLGSAALGPMAAWTAVVGFAGATAWMPTEAIQTASPNLQIVADLSAATADGDQAPLKHVRSITDTLGNENDLDVQVVTARSGIVETISPDKLSKVIPFGNSPMEDATRIAIDNSSELRKKAIANAAARTVGILILSNDNSANNASIVPKAKIEDVPVWTVNVGKDNENTGDLQAIAKGTDAKYWDANTVKPKEIRDEITRTLKSRSDPIDKQKPNRTAQAASVLTALYWPVMYGWRRWKMRPVNNGLEQERN